jgi:hypothetical protein
MKKNNTLIWVFAILTMIVICLLYFDVKYDIGEWLRKTPEVDTVYNEKIEIKVEMPNDMKELE